MRVAGAVEPLVVAQTHLEHGIGNIACSLEQGMAGQHMLAKRIAFEIGGGTGPDLLGMGRTAGFLACADVHQQARHARLARFGSGKVHLACERDHQRAGGQRVAIGFLAVLAATQQPVEGIEIALHRGVDIVDQRIDRARADAPAEARFDEHAADELGMAFGNAAGCAELLGRGDPGGGELVRGGARQTALGWRRGGRGHSPYRDNLARGHGVEPARGIDDHGFDGTALQRLEHPHFLQQELAFPEGMLEPASLQLVDEHAKPELGGFDAFQHGPF